jgi:hypothetical protein
MNNDDLYEKLIQLIDPIVDLLQSLNGEQQTAAATFVTLTVAKNLKTVEALGIMEHSKSLLLRQIEQRDDPSVEKLLGYVC